MPAPLRLLTRGSWSETQRFSEILRKETVGGMLLLAIAGTLPEAAITVTAVLSHRLDLAVRAIHEPDDERDEFVDPGSP